MTPDTATARRRLRAGMFPDPTLTETTMPTETTPPDAHDTPAPAVAIPRRPVGTRVVGRPVRTTTRVPTIDVPEQIICTGTVTRVIHVDRVRGDYCRVDFDSGIAIHTYLRFADELDIAPTAG